MALATTAAACGADETVTLDLSLATPDELPFYALLQDDDASGPVGAEGGTEVEIGGEAMGVTPIPVDGAQAPPDAADTDGVDPEAVDDGQATGDGGGIPAGGSGGGLSRPNNPGIPNSGGAEPGVDGGDGVGGGDEPEGVADGGSEPEDGIGSGTDDGGGADPGGDNGSDGSGDQGDNGNEPGDGDTEPEPDDTTIDGSVPSSTTTTTAPAPQSIDNVIDPTFFPDRPDATALNLFDDFSTVDQWLLYEQLIPSRPDCYALDLATAVQYTVDDNEILALTANEPGSTLSNHALLGRPVTDRPLPLGPHRFGLRTMIERGSESNIQTGPEFSIQITARMANGRYLTSVYGVQYVPWSGDWQILVGDEENFGWEIVQQARLTPGEWYDITLRFDTESDAYLELDVDGPGGFTVDITTELAALETVWQDKGLRAEATWVTVDVENLFTCDAPRVATATVYYDDVSLASE